MPELDDFKWCAEDTVFPSTYALCAYRNADGDFIIRQDDPMDDDAVIIIPFQRLPEVITFLQKLWTEAQDGNP